MTATPRPAAVATIKAVHTLAWLSIESCVVYVLYAGFAGRQVTDDAATQNPLLERLIRTPAV